MSPASTKSSSGRTIAGFILAVIFFLLAGLLWFNQQYVLDEIAVWEYKPTAEITQLADRAGVNDKGRFLYYASRPLIDGTQNFGKECGSSEQSTAILGCYAGGRIYVYNVTDARLDGIREVTAAHEMLHAAYQRMSKADKDKINPLLEAEYTKLENDPDFKTRMAFYASTEPGERDNELHSIIGTEVATISPELEEHYKQYFNDRNNVVILHNNYAAVFQKITDQAAQLFDQLDTMGKKIQADTDAYNTEVTTINADVQSFNSRATNNQFTSQAQFSSERAALSARVDAVAAKRNSIDAQIANYESLRAQYNQIATESKQLNDSLNSKLAPAPSV